MKPIYEIRSIIAQLMESSPARRRWTEHLIQSMWLECVGEKMAQHVRPVKVSEEHLEVEIDDDRWAKKLQ